MNVARVRSRDTEPPTIGAAIAPSGVTAFGPSTPKSDQESCVVATANATPVC